MLVKILMYLFNISEFATTSENLCTWRPNILWRCSCTDVLLESNNDRGINVHFGCGLLPVSPWVRQLMMKVCLVVEVNHQAPRLSSWVERLRAGSCRANWALPPLRRAGPKSAAPAVPQSGSSRWFGWSSDRRSSPRQNAGSSNWWGLLRRMEVRSQFPVAPWSKENIQQIKCLWASRCCSKSIPVPVTG